MKNGLKGWNPINSWLKIRPYRFSPLPTLSLPLPLPPTLPPPPPPPPPESLPAASSTRCGRGPGCPPRRRWPSGWPPQSSSPPAAGPPRRPWRLDGPRAGFLGDALGGGGVLIVGDPFLGLKLGVPAFFSGAYFSRPKKGTKGTTGGPSSRGLLVETPKYCK